MLINKVFEHIRGLFACLSALFRKDFKMSFSLRTKIGRHSEFSIKGKGAVGGRFTLMKDSTFIVNKGGFVSIGERVSFGYGCIIKIRKELVIGDNVLIGPNVLIYDHDHYIEDGMSDFDYMVNHFVTEGIAIGNNVWIGAGVIILKGTKIGDNCVIGAGTIVKGEVPSDSVLYQKRSDTLIKIKRDIK